MTVAEPMPERMPRVTCVVLNYNGLADTADCLRALLTQDYPALRIALVDNCSTDGSSSALHALFPQIEMVHSGRNGGFAFGCNAGIRSACARDADFIWLLNNDTVPPPDTLAKLIAAAQAQPQAGIVGTVLRYAHAPDRVQAWGGGTVSPRTGFSRHYLSPATPGPESFLTFASALVRREVVEQIGLLDDGFFMYFEDADFSFRARAAGWGLAVAAQTAVLHKEGSSVGSSAARPRRNPWLDRTVTASGMRFLARHGRPRWLAPWVYLLLRVGKRLTRGDFAGVRAVLGGMRDWTRRPAQIATP